MSFSEFKGLGETLKTFEIVYTEANFVEPLPFPVSDYFRQDLQLMMEEAVVDNSGRSTDRTLFSGATSISVATPSCRGFPNTFWRGDRPSAKLCSTNPILCS
jgi:hypothetical protein